LEKCVAPLWKQSAVIAVCAEYILQLCHGIFDKSLYLRVNGILDKVQRCILCALARLCATRKI